MAKPRRRKATLHSAGKVTEADLLERARRLADDPTLAMPTCAGPCVLFSPVTAARKGIMKAHAARDDEGKLQKLAAGGNDLARAYAATLLVARSEKIPYVAELRLGGENVPYVMRGKAKPLYLAGLQHHDDRALRLLSVTTWAKKRRLNFFSTDEGIVCTGRSRTPPPEFVEQEMALLGLESTGGSVYACAHGGCASGEDALVLSWTAASVEMQRCAACAKEGSLLAQILRHIAGQDRRKAFDVRVELMPLAGRALDVTAPLPDAVKNQYLAGGMTDAQLIAAAHEARVGAIRALGRRVLVAAETSYADDVDAFLDALNPSDAERRAIRVALEKEDAPLVLDRASAARALAELWPRHGKLMLDEAARHDATATRLHRDTVTPEEAAELIRRAAKEGAATAVAETLPTYGRLPPAASAVDAIARAFRANGKEAAVRVALEQAAQPMAKGVVLAALQELDAAKGQEWRFTNADQDVASNARDAVRALLRDAPETYHASLVDASARSGETATFAPR